MADAYNEAVRIIQSSKVSAAPKKGGKAPKRRDFKSRVFPKAAIRKLALKANISRMAYGPSNKGVACDQEKDTYGFIDQNTFSLMENIIHDAVTIAHATRKSSKGKSRIIKERHMLKAIERHGGIGLASSESRKTMF